MSADFQSQADLFEKWAARLNASITRRTAATGTIYITADATVARFSNHGTCYACEDISVDPIDGLTWWMAIEVYCRQSQKPVPATVKSARSKFNKIQALHKAERATQSAIHSTVNYDLQQEMHDQMVAWIEAQPSESGPRIFKDMGAKARKKWRARAREALGLPNFHMNPYNAGIWSAA